jgi:hypothetical protein
MNLFAVALIALWTPVAAQENQSGETIPDIPSNYCVNLSNLAGGSELIKNSCIDSERESKANVERMWSDIPKDVRKQCIALSKMAMTSYQGLAGCMALYVSNIYLKGGFKLSSCKMTGDIK